MEKNILEYRVVQNRGHPEDDSVKNCIMKKKKINSRILRSLDSDLLVIPQTLHMLIWSQGRQLSNSSAVEPLKPGGHYTTFGVGKVLDVAEWGF